MPIKIPTRQALVDGLKNRVRLELPKLNPATQRRNYIGGLVVALSSALHDWYLAFKRHIDIQMFPQTATGISLRRGWWTDLTKLSPNPAVGSSGDVAFPGTAGVIIPDTTTLISNGITFNLENSVTISDQPSTGQVAYSVTTGQATFTATGTHLFHLGQDVTITGASDAAYNGTFPLLSVDGTTFTYEPATVPADAGPLAATSNATFGVGKVRSVEVGQQTNLGSGETLSYDPPANATGTAHVLFSTVSGGTDAETDESYRTRILQALGTDYGTFTSDEIDIVARSVPGVTRVWVREAQLNPLAGFPEEGQVKIAFMRDDDSDPFPSVQEVTDVKDQILNTIKPAHTCDDDVIVVAPTPLTVNFTLSGVLPADASMRTAIENSLQQFFREGVEFGTAIDEIDYQCAINDAFDLESNQAIQSFVLTAPTGPIAVGPDELPVLGTVSFS